MPGRAVAGVRISYYSFLLFCFYPNRIHITYIVSLLQILILIKRHFFHSLNTHLTPNSTHNSTKRFLIIGYLSHQNDTKLHTQFKNFVVFKPTSPDTKSILPPDTVCSHTTPPLFSLFLTCPSRARRPSPAGVLLLSFSLFYHTTPLKNAREYRA